MLGEGGGFSLADRRAALQKLIHQAKGAAVEAFRRGHSRSVFTALGSEGVTYFSGQDLAQLHAPLIEAVDAPDEALYGNAMLVQREKLADRVRRADREKETDTGLVAEEGLMRYEILLHLFGAKLSGGFAVG